MNMELEQKSHPPWTDDFLDQMRQVADKLYDIYIRDILDQSFIERYKGVFEDWVKLQTDQKAEVRRILNSFPERDDLTPIAIQATDALSKLQIQQHKSTDRWTLHLWPQDFHFHIQSARLATLNACKALANYELQTAHAAMKAAWTNGTLLVKNFDKLLAIVSSDPSLSGQMSEENRDAYNRFLQAVEAIRMNPGIYLWDRSFRKIQFEAYPRGLNINFSPVVCPTWIDEEKLKLGVKIWKRHMAECLLVLFAHSLPACYLDHKGIPMLYETHRLGKQEFLAERIYETGFFLHDVMKEDGLVVLEEPIAERIAWLAFAVHNAHPDWHFQFGRYLVPEWHDSNGSVHSYSEVLADPAIKDEFNTLAKQGKVPGSYSASELGTPNFEQLFRACLEGVRNPTANFLHGRCLWGPGFLATHKVRYFHAEMRYRALQAQPPFDVAKNGMPINQEDLAYTLLTFGYVIPVGLEKLGAIITRAEKEGFLHCWKIVGHLIGIKEELLTDDWDEAKELYEKIKNRQKGSSINGIRLTNAICTFITRQLPKWLPFRSAIPAVWIRDQLGADADDLFDEKTKAASRNLPVRICWAFVKHVLLRWYFVSRQLFWDKFQFSRRSTDIELKLLGEALLTSWHQTFKRQRFDLTAGLKGFKPDVETSTAEKKKRHQIRRKVFFWVLIGFGLVVIRHPIFWIGFVGFVAWHLASGGWGGALTKVMFWMLILDQVFLSYITRRLQRFLKQLAIKSGPQF